MRGDNWWDAWEILFGLVVVAVILLALLTL